MRCLNAVLALVGALEASAPANEVCLRAMDRFGTPIQNATVCAAPSVEGAECRAIDFTFREPGLLCLSVPLSARVLRLSAIGFETGTWEPEEALTLPAQPGVKSIALKARGSISATFVAAGRPREAAAIELWRQKSQKEMKAPKIFERSIVTGGSRTKIEITDLPQGRYDLLWEGPTYARGRVEVVVRDGPVDVGTKVLMAGRNIEGSVLSDEGTPIAGARLRFMRADSARSVIREATTGDDGFFVLRSLPVDEEIDWSISSPGFLDAQERLGAESGLVISLERAWRIHGRLVRSDKTPVTGGAIAIEYLLSETPRVTAGFGEIEVKPQGTFEAFFTKRAPVTLNITSKGTRKVTKQFPAPSPETSKDRDLGDIVLSEGRALDGTVFDKSSGAALAGVVVREIGTSAPNEATTDPDGHFSLSGLPVDADSAVSFLAPRYGKANRKVAQGTDHVEVALDIGGEIAGRVCASVEEVDETVVNLFATTAAGDAPETRVGIDSRFRFENLEPGTYTLSRSYRLDSGGRHYSVVGTGESVTVQVEAGRTVEAALGCDGLPVMGVVAVDGIPLGGGYGWLVMDGGGPIPLRTDATGRFSARVNSPGRLSAHVSAPSGRRLSDAFCMVPPGGTNECVIALSVVPSR